MNKDGEIVIIEDNHNDQTIFEDIFNSLSYTNKRVYFSNGLEALQYYMAKKPSHS
ncbi:hypothetical protein [Dyadobacter sp. CY323]|uniref:hypothetical protein n=1 Tax=Dyadobacter sp. CY323 TaxID=2907302 RepID=UPI001F1C8979|nr:hypothetical protein [Dyadobacter sp. CY323]MCE6992119.1 hypothetical protein [Dyadobacter sp. CY323]